MGPTLDASIALVAIAPFLAALLAPLTHRFVGSYCGWVLAIVPASIFMFLVKLIGPVIDKGFIAASIQWVPSYHLALSFYLDGLSLTFALTISGIGTLIVLYAGPYLAGHGHQGRFYSFLLAFMGAMLGLVLADNMLALFGFWELTAVTSFLLIGFDHTRQAARRAAIQALVVTNIGGLSLLLAVLVIQQLGGNWEISKLGALQGSALYPLVLALVLLAAFTKSAQVPFHFWLPNAMEAPTPVSAFLHSATMVQAGVYLLARLTPALGGTPEWTAILTIFGGVTLLWGGFAALKQTDMKQMLAQTTIASLGLLVLLIGIGSETAIAAMVVYFVAHALYKAGFFMLVGVIDHATGTRDITALGGLMGKLPLTFAAAVLAGLGMIGLPLTLGYLAKEEMYLALEQSDWRSIVLLLTVILGNGLLGAIALALVIKPFLGQFRSTPKPPHEGSFGLVAGPLLLGVLGLAGALATGWFGSTVLVPAASAVLGHATTSHLTLVPDFGGLVPFLSVLTWALGAVLFMQSGVIRAALRRSERSSWNFDAVFDALMFGLIRSAAAITRLFHHGRLELYLLIVFIGFAVAISAPLLLNHGYDGLLATADWVQLFGIRTVRPFEWAVLALAIAGLLILLFSFNRLVAVLALGIQGTATALIFLLFGAPDLAFTQFMVEILSVVVLALVITRLKLDERDRRPYEDLARDGIVALLCGVAVTLLLAVVLTGTLDTKLSDFFTATSVPIAHGRNIVNVILVDYRGLDTLGEISVVMGAGIAILGLLRRRRIVP
ncbi:hydrogen gas-evolving membrane-bound hydrogenase subunit E [Devosia sp.]|uniref:hydrogen gas-evolving membrane-bound hydrogenase subunit E n=1 Tax=Devosia sp. TaxID=1871048 RepID=UPI003264BB70